MTDDRVRKARPRSRLVHMGREADLPAAVNPPIQRGSTYLHDSVASLRAAEKARAEGHRARAYGRRGTETSFLLEDALTEMEGGAGARLASSGLAANALVFQALLRPGDHAVIGDGVYGPVRRYAAKVLAAFGIDFDFCAADASDLAAKITPRTRLVYVETPGSTLFEVVDLPKAARLCHDAGALLAVDNTWGSALIHRPLTLGADVSVLSATKYLSGHSDVLLGAVVANERAWPAINDMAEWTGISTSPDDAYLVLRGLRTLDVRLREQARQAAQLVEWFRTRPFVTRVYYPPLPTHPGHEIWRRDFSGANGVFSVELAPGSDAQAEAFVDALELFGIGSSWGGYESLLRLENVAQLRSVSAAPAGPVIRISAGLEDIDDLLADLDVAAAQVWGNT